MSRKKKIIVTVAAGLLVLGLLLGGAFLFQIFRVENRFPMWEPAPTEETARDPQFFPGLKLAEERAAATAEKIEFDVEDPSTGITGDAVTVVYRAKAERVGSTGALWWVEYFHKGNWYIVYTPWKKGIVPLSAHVLDGPIYEHRFIFPAGTLAMDGQYRIYKDGLPYCYFEMDSAGRDKALL